MLHLLVLAMRMMPQAPTTVDRCMPPPPGTHLRELPATRGRSSTICDTGTLIVSLLYPTKSPRLPFLRTSSFQPRHLQSARLLKGPRQARRHPVAVRDFRAAVLQNPARWQRLASAPQLHLRQKSYCRLRFSPQLRLHPNIHRADPCFT